MEYKHIVEGKFISRPNRFVAYVSIGGETEKAHVKNTGRCQELLTEDAVVYLEKCGWDREGAKRKDGPKRATAYDLVAVKKGERIVNMDSNAPNRAVGEWLLTKKLFPSLKLVQAEKTYRNSRFDFYVETEEEKIFLEVKGVTLEREDTVYFPDAPSERAVKHVEELIEAKKEGYGAYIVFVAQMEGVRAFSPNRETHPAFAEALERAKQPYYVWLSEIMLQQTRVEAVKPYFDRFIQHVPDIPTLAGLEEEKLVKLWEGLGYYNRVRNLQKAARMVMEKYAGKMPSDYRQLMELPGIGSYTAGAIASIAYGQAVPAVDGNVLRVLARLRMDGGDILSQKTKSRVEAELEKAMPADRAGDFNQALMELGAMVCLPNGEPRCGECPWKDFCRARQTGRWREFPKKKPKKARTVEEKTVLVIKDGERAALCKRPGKGLLAGMYGFPMLEGYRTEEEVLAYLRGAGLQALHIQPIGDAKHIFSHKEWHMRGYAVRVDELEPAKEGGNGEGWVFIEKQEARERYPIPSAYAAYAKYLDIRLGV